MRTLIVWVWAASSASVGPASLRIATSRAPVASPGEAADDDRGARTVRRAWREALERSAGDRRLALRAAARELGLKRPELQRRLDELGE